MLSVGLLLLLRARVAQSEETSAIVCTPIQNSRLDSPQSQQSLPQLLFGEVVSYLFGKEDINSREVIVQARYAIKSHLYPVELGYAVHSAKQLTDTDIQLCRAVKCFNTVRPTKLDLISDFTLCLKRERASLATSLSAKRCLILSVSIQKVQQDHKFVKSRGVAKLLSGRVALPHSLSLRNY